MKYIPLTFIILLSIACSNPKSDPVESPPAPDSTGTEQVQSGQIEVRVFADTAGGVKGFGYDIFINEKLYIHQPNIPAVEGLKKFSSEEKAKKAGELMIYKIRQNIMPPTLSAGELDSLGVL